MANIYKNWIRIPKGLNRDEISLLITQLAAHIEHYGFIFKRRESLEYELLPFCQKSQIFKFEFLEKENEGYNKEDYFGVRTSILSFQW